MVAKGTWASLPAKLRVGLTIFVLAVLIGLLGMIPKATPLVGWLGAWATWTIPIFADIVVAAMLIIVGRAYFGHKFRRDEVRLIGGLVLLGAGVALVGVFVRIGHGDGVQDFMQGQPWWLDPFLRAALVVVACLTTYRGLRRAK